MLLFGDGNVGLLKADQGTIIDAYGRVGRFDHDFCFGLRMIFGIDVG